MDITAKFRSCAQARRETDKKLGSNNTNSDLFRKRRSCEFIRKFKDLLREITQLRDFLLQHRKAYLNLTPNFIKSEQMSESERDKIDSGAQQIIKACSGLVLNFRRELSTLDHNNQRIQNHLAIVDLLEAYLKTVCKIYTEQKAIRVKWTIEVEKMSKLESAKEFIDKSSSNDLGDWDIKDEDVQFKASEPPPVPRPPSTASYAFADDDNALSEEELQMFEMENQHLYNDLNSLNEEVKAIQSKVVKIAELQEVFTDKVLEQNEEIERISTTLVGTTENVKDANTQIREAIRGNASFRIYVLFFILVMSFSLLFLDWYND